MSCVGKLFSVDSSAMFDKAASFRMPFSFASFFFGLFSVPLDIPSERLCYFPWNEVSVILVGLERPEIRFNCQLVRDDDKLKNSRDLGMWGKIGTGTDDPFLFAHFVWIPLIAKFGFDPEEVLVTSLVASSFLPFGRFKPRDGSVCAIVLTSQDNLDNFWQASG